MRRVLAISSIGNQPHNLHGKYIAGAGVGASSISARRLKLHRSTECYPPSKTEYKKVSDIATYVPGVGGSLGQWVLNEDTVISPNQCLVIYTINDLHIPYNITFTNNGQINIIGSLHLDTYGTSGATVYNTGIINNYGSLQITDYCRFYTYGGGSVYNSYESSANIVVSGGMFAFSNDENACGLGTFTGKPLSGGSVSYTCP